MTLRPQFCLQKGPDHHSVCSMQVTAASAPCLFVHCRQSAWLLCTLCLLSFHCDHHGGGGDVNEPWGNHSSSHWKLWSIPFLTLTLSIFFLEKNNTYLYAYRYIVWVCYVCMFVCVWLWTYVCQYQVQVLSFPGLACLWDCTDHLSIDGVVITDPGHHICPHVHSGAQTQTCMLARWEQVIDPASADSWCASI